jgi:hypothetical protein
MEHLDLTDSLPVKSEQSTTDHSNIVGLTWMRGGKVVGKEGSIVSLGQSTKVRILHDSLKYIFISSTTED